MFKTDIMSSKNIYLYKIGCITFNRDIQWSEIRKLASSQVIGGKQIEF